MFSPCEAQADAIPDPLPISFPCRRPPPLNQHQRTALPFPSQALQAPSPLHQRAGDPVLQPVAGGHLCPHTPAAVGTVPHSFLGPAVPHLENCFTFCPLDFVQVLLLLPLLAVKNLPLISSLQLLPTCLCSGPVWVWIGFLFVPLVTVIFARNTSSLRRIRVRCFQRSHPLPSQPSFLPAFTGAGWAG